jgi:hypothetical protein
VGERADAARTIAIKFGAGAHSDAYPFDGPRKVLAHTFYPSPVTSRSRATCTWMGQAGAGIDLYSVTLHELGHALRLGHSSAGRGDVLVLPQASALTGDDIAGIQSLYGMPVVVEQPAVSGPALQPGAPSVPVAPSAPTSRGCEGHDGPDVKLSGATMETTSSASIKVSGTATHNVGVVAVKWTGVAGVPGRRTGPATGR